MDIEALETISFMQRKAKLTCAFCLSMQNRFPLTSLAFKRTNTESIPIFEEVSLKRAWQNYVIPLVPGHVSNCFSGGFFVLEQ